MFYFLRSPGLAAKSARGAIEICAARLIPSLFPFIVLVSIINFSGLSQFIAYIVGKPIELIFGINRCAAPAILLGTLGGFPVGAVCTHELYDSGLLSKSDAERLLTYTNNASPAFCIATIGSSFFGDIAFGVRLYVCQICAAMMIGILQRKTRCGLSASRCVCKTMTISDSITSAVSSGAATMLKICAFAVFFAVVGDALCAVISHHFGKTAAALAAAVCELTLGAGSCTEIGEAIARPLCAFAAGWSGVSVHMQVASVISESRLSMKRYYLCKAMQGVISALMIAVIYAS